MSSAKSKKNLDTAKSMLIYEVDPTECPFREFKDNELSPDLWGLGPAACRAAILMGKAAKSPLDQIWMDEQTQPLPRSVRQYLDGWIRAEDLAADRWGAEIVVFEESDGSGKMSVVDTQLSHAQVLVRSSFCRKVLSACFVLERVEGLAVEHQWENFVVSFAEGWRARYHIYSPGMKPGGGQQHRPAISKNGCYLVRLYYLGAWRCVWVNDKVPVDATDAPLLPFSPVLRTQPSKPGVKSAPTTVFAQNVYLWPMLICKALLKLAAPDMSADADELAECVEDEPMPEFDIMHALTGCIGVTYTEFDEERLWSLVTADIPVFTWEDDDVTATSTVKSKPKKPAAKESREDRTRSSLGTILIADTKEAPPYLLPGITPGHEMILLVNMARDLPLKKPLPEPEVALWKYYRWVDWARRHGLYEAYDCPRTRFLKVTGLMKLSYAPHLLDVISTESITYGYRQEHERTSPQGHPKKGGKPDNTQGSKPTSMSANQLGNLKEELREWMQFKEIEKLAINLNIVYFPSMFEYTTTASSPPVRITKAAPDRALDIVAPKCAPLYLQIDGPDENTLRLALTMIHPRVMLNCGLPTDDYIEPAYLILEEIEWFKDCQLPVPKAYVHTRGYNSVEVKFLPGRHYCRLWVHSRLNWHAMLLSQSTLLLGSRDIVQAAAVVECPWAARFLTNLSNAFSTWIRYTRSNTAIMTIDRDFFMSYKPDLTWDNAVVGYNQALLHWMFRQALQSVFRKKLPSYEYLAVCKVMRHYFCDPDFGLPPKPLPPNSLSDIVDLDPCDCVMSVDEELGTEEYTTEEVENEESNKPVVEPELMAKLLKPPVPPAVSQICEFATEELPCGVLKEERVKVIKMHEAATFLQAHWRGAWARQCLNVKVLFTPDVTKLVMDNAFGNLEALSALMNEFFEMFPGAKTAYSVASALSGVSGLIQHQGVTNATPTCKWIPYFQGVFYCHVPVKAHITVHSSIPYSTVMVYNNDTGAQLPQAYNTHITYDIAPNINGYTVMGHGTLNEAKGVQFDVNWNLTILSSRNDAFHICDNDPERCAEQLIPGSQKVQISEMFVPNRRNILGGLLLSVTKQEAISFHAAASSPDLDMVATLRVISPNGDVEELATCKGKGEIYWPYIRLQPFSPEAKKKSVSKVNLAEASHTPAQTPRAAKSVPKKTTVGAKMKSMTKMAVVEPKQYSIQVTAPSGWPLTLGQWKRVDEVRNSDVYKRRDSPVLSKKHVKGGKGNLTATSATAQTRAIDYTPLPDDAYVELECSLAKGGGTTGRRDDMRNLAFQAAKKLWDAKEPGRNLRGAQIRNEFREEFLVVVAPPRTEVASTTSIEDELFGEEIEDEESKKESRAKQQGPSPATESGMLEMSVEMEEEATYLSMPDQLRKKFQPLYFLPLCTKEKNDEEIALLTSDMAEAAKQDRHARIEASVERFKELQAYNEEHVLQRQKDRCRRLENLCVDSFWCQELADILEERDEAIAREQLMRNISATKKKQDQKDQKGAQQGQKEQKRKK